MIGTLPISLCIFVKDEEKTIIDCIESVLPIVSEIVVVDTGSTDNTVTIAKTYTDRVYEVPFTDFGSIRTLTAHLASQPWVLMLDADERVDSQEWGKIRELINVPPPVPGDKGELDVDGNVIIDSYAWPRKRWADLWMRKQVDTASYPDWQVRLFRNHTLRRKISFVRRVHETVNGCVKTVQCPTGPTINHFQNVDKDNDHKLGRQLLYTNLHALDIEEGVEHSEPAVVDMDKVKVK